MTPKKKRRAVMQNQKRTPLPQKTKKSYTSPSAKITEKGKNKQPGKSLTHLISMKIKCIATN